jgi:hypothetical protein
MSLPRGLIATALAALVGLAGATIARPAVAAPYDDWNPDIPGYPSNAPHSPRANCAGGSDQCIERTIGEMERRFHRVIPRCDHNAVFSLTYLRVTEDVRDAVETGFYPDKPWINQFDAMFARPYFLAYDNWREGRRELVPESWRLAFDTGRDESVQGLGNLLLSMNAHINRDFPYILYHVGLTDEDGSSKKPEHDSYNPRLRAMYKPMLTELAHRFDETIDDYDVPGITADDDAFFQLLVQWRDSAWRNAVRLAEADGDAERRDVARSIEAYANTWAGLIRAGAAYPPGQDAEARKARSDRCARFGGQRRGYRRGADVARPGRVAALRGAKRLTVRLRCPHGPGPCKGRLAALRPRRDAGGRLPALGNRRFHLKADSERRLRLQLGRRGIAPLRAHPERGVWLRARSRLGPGVAVSERRKARLTPHRGGER